MGTYFHRRSWVTWRWTGPLVKGARRVWADKSSKLKDLTRNVTAAFNWSNSRRVCSAPEHGYCHLQVVIRWNVERNEKCTLKVFMKFYQKSFNLIWVQLLNGHEQETTTETGLAWIYGQNPSHDSPAVWSPS